MEFARVVRAATPYVAIIGIVYIIGDTSNRYWPHAAPEEPAATAPESSDETFTEPAMDAADPVNVTVDKLVVDFGENEVAANRKWSAIPIRLTGYVKAINDLAVPELKVKAIGDYWMTAEVPDRDTVAEVKDGETVDLLCQGASSAYGSITAHSCWIDYHGKRRNSDPYWPDPYAIQDPL